VKPVSSWRDYRLLGLVGGAVLLGIAGLWATGMLRGGSVSIEAQAERFVSAGLALGRHVPDEVDSYFGPEALRPSIQGKQSSLEALRDDLAQLERDLAEARPDVRQARLLERTGRLKALVDMMAGGRGLSFDEEARQLYGLDPARLDNGRFERARAELDHLLPGPGTLTRRVEAYRERFMVPEDKRAALFTRALAECRARTLKHWKLPADEALEIEWTTQAGAAWHRYLGDYRSRLQVNPQAVAFMGSIIDVACHEGYPGHHTQFVLEEAAAGKGRLPVEDRIVFLRAPGSVVREGAAEYAVLLVFPQAERLAFERDVLFPMSGLPPGEAEHFERVRALLDQLAPAALPILRDYRDHRITAQAAAAALDADALIGSPEALLGFADRYGAYVSGYTGVREQVRGIAGSDAADVSARWERLRCLLRLADEMPLGQIAGAIGRTGGIPDACKTGISGAGS